MQINIESPLLDSKNGTIHGVRIILLLSVPMANNIFFGSIDNGVMTLSKVGKIVHNEWMKAPIVRPDMNITLFDFIIMPNHLHAIIKIGRNKYNKNYSLHGDIFSVDSKEKDKIVNDSRRDAMHCVSTSTPHGYPPSIPNRRNNFGPQRKNLPAIIRGFKSGVTKKARYINSEFAWQSRYYDQIVRDEKSFYVISKYINNNPSNWSEDEYFIIQ